MNQAILDRRIEWPSLTVQYTTDTEKLGKSFRLLQQEHTSAEPSQPKEDGNPYLQTSLTRASSKTSQSSFTPHFDRKAPTSNSYPTEQQPRNHKQPHGQSMSDTLNHQQLPLHTKRVHGTRPCPCRLDLHRHRQAAMLHSSSPKFSNPAFIQEPTRNVYSPPSPGLPT